MLSFRNHWLYYFIVIFCLGCNSVLAGSVEDTAQIVERDLDNAINAAVLELKPSHVAEPPENTVSQLEPRMVASRIHHRPIVVVIDPGHGGKDSGTVSRTGVQEKTVVLAISKKLKALFDKDSEFRALLTRDRDFFIPLRQRLAIAHRNKADLFIAIHADAYIRADAMGSSVFALSAHGASSEAARWLAEKENYSELGGVSLQDKSYMLRSILIDLSQTATITDSLQIGRALLKQLSQICRLHRGFVEQAPFMVLKNPDIPSLLIETGFLSNAFEAQRLNSPDYQEQIARAIATGVKYYFSR